MDVEPVHCGQRTTWAFLGPYSFHLNKGVQCAALVVEESQGIVPASDLSIQHSLEWKHDVNLSVHRVCHYNLSSLPPSLLHCAFPVCGRRNALCSIQQAF